MLALSTQKFAYQDAVSLIAQEIAPSDRWQARLVVGAADARKEIAKSGPQTIDAAAKTATLAGPVAFQAARVVTVPRVDPPNTSSVAKTIAAAGDMINRGNKGDLLIRPNYRRLGFNAGLVHNVALFAPPEISPNLPRTAFILPPTPKPAPTKAESEKAKDVAGDTKSAEEKPAAKPVALAYAATDDNEKSDAPFNAVIAKPGTIVLDPDIKASHAWVNNAIPKSAHSRKEMKCLADAIYFEARGEPELGRIAVAQVVLNRLKNPAYPSTICGVVYQNQNKRNRCQFSFACDGIRERITDKAAWTSAQDLAERVMDDDRTLYIKEVGASTHYHATYVRPRWARHMTKKDKIGHHIFYQTYNGGWS